MDGQGRLSDLRHHQPPHGTQDLTRHFSRHGEDLRLSSYGSRHDDKPCDPVLTLPHGLRQVRAFPQDAHHQKSAEVANESLRQSHGRNHLV